MPEQPIGMESPLKYLSLTSRGRGASSSKKKAKVFVPGVTEVTEDGDDDDGDEDGLQISEGKNRKALALNKIDLSVDMGHQTACKSARNINFNMKELT